MKQNRLARAIVHLHGVMARLRAPEGCPWDARQTPASLRPYLLEESYELLEALDDGNPRQIRDELGDLLLQIVFHAQIFAERGDFDLADVAAAIAAKLVRRHPHVFHGAETGDAAELDAQWERIKNQEKGHRNRRRVTDGIPCQLPALQRAAKVLDRVRRSDLQAEDFAPLEQQLERFLGEQHDPHPEAARLEVLYGDLLLAAVARGQELELDAEDALRRSLRRFLERLPQREEHIPGTSFTGQESGEGA